MANAQKTFYTANSVCGVYNPSFPGQTMGHVSADICGMVGETNTNKGTGTRVRAIHGYKFNIDWTGMWGIEAATLRLRYFNNVEIGSGYSGLDDYASNLTSIYTVGLTAADWWRSTPIIYSWDTAWWALSPNWNNLNNYAYGSNQQKTAAGTANNAAMDFDVTAMVQALFSGYPNYGFRVGLDSHQGAAFLDLQERSMNFVMNAAELIITYTINQSPNAPTNLQPTGNAVILGATPQLSATVSDPDVGDYATGWNIQVVTDDCTNPDTATSAQKMYAQYLTGQSATNNIVTNVGNASGMYWNQTLQAGNYYKWRIRTLDKGSAWGPWSGLSRWYCNFPPDAPTPSLDQTPLNDIKSLSPVLSFGFSDPATGETQMHGYRVVMEERIDGTYVANYDSGEIDLSSSPTASTTHNLTGLEWATAYRVKVRVVDQYGAPSPYSPWLYFETHETDPPTNMAPDLSEAVGYTPTLSGARYGTVDTIDSYWLHVYDNDNNDMWQAQEFFDPQTGGLTFSKTYAGSQLTSGETYSWRARIDSPIGGLSDWSAPATFTVVDAAVPEIRSPEGHSSYTLTPTVTITRAGTFDAVQYQIYYADASSVDPGVDDAGTDAHWASGTITSGISAGGLGTQYGGTYSGTSLDWYDFGANNYDGTTGLQPYGHYKIRARVSSDSGSNWSAWSGFVVFYTDYALPPVLTSIDGVVNDPAWITSLAPTFAMTATGTDVFDYYNIRILDGLHQNLDNPIYETGFINLDPNATTVSWLYDGPEGYLVPGVDYTWDGALQDTTGVRSDFSSYRTFVINNPPDTPALIYPSNNGGHAANDPLVFLATFSDRDVARFNDGPTHWQIKVYTPSSIEQELVLNGTFDYNLLHWTVPSSGVDVSWVANLGPNGTDDGALRIVNDDQEATVKSVRQSVNVTAGETYVYAVDYWLDTSDGLRIDVSWRNGSDEQISVDYLRSSDATADSEWHNAWQDMIAPTGAVAALLRLYTSTGSGAEARFDNVTFINKAAHLGGGTVERTTSLNVGVNSFLWNGGALQEDVEYAWSCRFRDTKGAWSEWAPWSTFFIADEPNGSWSNIDNDTQLATTTPTVSWTNSVVNAPQGRYQITIQRTDGNGVPIWGPVNFGPYNSTDTSFTVPPGVLVNTYSYNMTITIWSQKGLVDPTPDTVEVDINLDAPNPALFTQVTANAERSNIYLTWTRPTDSPPVYIKGYRLYRKKRWLEDYQLIAEFFSPSQTSWTDYYAGNSVNYTYKIVAIGQKAGSGVFIEGQDEADSFWTIQNNSDNWTIVGRDRNAAHIYDMIVVDEDHNRPIQQEEFETLGADRKVIMRGFVLGHEGSITAIWTNTSDPLPKDEQEYVNHTQIGRSLIEYMTFDAGPHIIKSPFGDVWDVQILTPEYKWLPSGHLETTIKYVETGQTSQPEGD